MQSAKCKTQTIGAGLEARRAAAAVCCEDRKIGQCTSGESAWPACGRTVDSRWHGSTSELRRGPRRGESRRFHPQVEHRLERTSRIENLASIYHSRRIVEANPSPAAPVGVRGTLSRHRKVNCYSQDTRPEGKRPGHWGKCKMKDAKFKVQSEPANEASDRFALCILYFALTTSALP